MTTAERVRKLVKPYARLPLECDGMTRVISYLLHQNGIEHKIFVGSISVKRKGKFSPHYWIRLRTGEIVDYRSRMWFNGDKDIPEGVFPENRKVVVYKGEEVPLPVSEVVFKILTANGCQKSPKTMPAIAP